MKDFKKILLCFVIGIVLIGCSGVSDVKENHVEKFKIYLDINFNGNIIFDKYNVDLYLDGDKIAELEHGIDYIDAVNLEKGKHVLKFVSEEDEEVSSSESFTIKKNSNFQCTIETHKDSIDITDINFIESLKGIELEMPDVTNELLTEANSILKDSGLENYSSKAQEGSIWEQ